MTENGTDTSGPVGGTSKRTAPPSSSSSSSSFPLQHESDDAANNQTMRSSKRLTTPFNHFENYFQIKSRTNVNNSNDADTLSQDETTSFTTHTSRKELEADEVSNQYNHFTAPFKSNNVLITTSRDAPLLSSPSSPFTDYERSQTLDRFAKIFMERMGEAMSSGKLIQAWGRGEGDDGDGAYSLERDMVKPHITPIVWGSSCVLLTLFSMRCGRWYQQQQLRSLWKRSGTMKNADAAATASMSTTIRQRHPSLLEDVRQSGINSRHPNFNNSGINSRSGGIDMTVPVDISLSLLFGISTTIFLTDKHRLLHDFAHAPLLEGRSVLAEELCLPFQKEMMANITTVGDDDAAKASDDLWHDENLGEFDSLRAIRDFVTHCHLRERRIEKNKIKGRP